MDSSGNNKTDFSRAAEKSVTKELDELGKKILSDLAEMISDAHSLIIESEIFPKFSRKLNGRIADTSDLNSLRSNIIETINEHNPGFLIYFDVIVELDNNNPKNIGFEFKIKPEKIIE